MTLPVRQSDVVVGDHVITLKDDALILRFPTGRFRDVLVDGLYASPQNSDAGRVRVRFWTPREVGIYYHREDRWNRYGRRIARVVRWAGYEPSGNGLVQRAARRLDIPLALPADRNTLISNCRVVGREEPRKVWLS